LAEVKDVEVDLIRWIWAFIDRPLGRFEQAAAFWTTVTDSRLSARRGSDGEFATLLHPSGHPALKLQSVHGPGGVHLDLEVDDVPAATDAARGLGATVVTPHVGWAVEGVLDGADGVGVPRRRVARVRPAQPPPGLAIRILLQRLGSDRAASAHVDLACSDIQAARSWHEQCGARVVGSGPHWIVMEDPTGGTSV
jgi:hypothetical protein